MQSYKMTFWRKPNMKIYLIYEFVENTLTMTIEEPNKKT